MGIEWPLKTRLGKKTHCGCGGHGYSKTAALAPYALRTIKFGRAPRHQCNCSGGSRCPRHYLAPTGYLLGGFLILHLAINALALSPGKFQATVDRIHSLGSLLPVLELSLASVMTFHIIVGLRLMRRDKLKFVSGDHYNGSPMRQWLQRLTAVIMLAFILFHVVTMHRWFGGRFDAHDAFNSASHAVWQFWHGEPAGSISNLLFAQFYLVGLVAAVYHLTNGAATGAEVLGWVRTPVAQNQLWRVCLVTAPVLLLAGLAAWYAFAVR